MDANAKVKLIKRVITYGSLRQEQFTETFSEVYAQIDSITRDEWYNAGKNGIKATYRVTVYLFEYANETIVEVNGERLSVYRTYVIPNTDEIELYLETQGGTE